MAAGRGGPGSRGARLSHGGRLLGSGLRVSACLLHGRLLLLGTENGEREGAAQREGGRGSEREGGVGGSRGKIGREGKSLV